MQAPRLMHMQPEFSEEESQQGEAVSAQTAKRLEEAELQQPTGSGHRQSGGKEYAFRKEPRGVWLIYLY